jgi:hypothetical protein
MHWAGGFGHAAGWLEGHGKPVIPLGPRQGWQSEEAVSRLIHLENPGRHGFLADKGPQLVDSVAGDLGQTGGQEHTRLGCRIPQEMSVRARARR